MYVVAYQPGSPLVGGWRTHPVTAKRYMRLDNDIGYHYVQWYGPEPCVMSCVTTSMVDMVTDTSS